MSDFVTVQSFANFAVMTGAISGAWHALQKLWPGASSLWVPYVSALVWAIISFIMSLDGLKKGEGAAKGHDLGTMAGALFMALINALVLAGAVVGTEIVVNPTP